MLKTKNEAAALSAQCMDELESTLEDIWSGKLRHDQSIYLNDCGTVACLAGWLMARYHPSSSGVIKSFDVDSYLEGSRNPMIWCANRYGLTCPESKLLFSPGSTELIHRATLKAFKAGRRLQVTPEVWTGATWMKKYKEYPGDIFVGYTQGQPSEPAIKSLKVFFDCTSLERSELSNSQTLLNLPENLGK